MSEMKSEQHLIQQKVYSFIVLSWAKELRIEQVIFLCRKSILLFVQAMLWLMQ